MATEHDSVAASIELLWQEPVIGKRGPRPKFTIEGIVAAATAIADEDGLDAVTMQRVAERLGTAKMALYRYVPGRAELDAVLLDRALGGPPASPEGDWRSALAAWTLALHERSLEHPWSVTLAQRPHVPGPGELAWYESGLRAMGDLPLSGGEQLDVLALLAGHAQSMVRQRAGGPHPELDLADRLGPVLAARSADYPRTSAAFADAARGGGRDAALHFGIDRLLAGVAALIAERTDRARA
ncbi:TetR/AcrR family transcriptional regulator [Microbacterium yannicii]|uniref:TetR/AcrR family transcriptional regulator n=1 Tax=Microbacterium yannicii TaxID=671622 RepID=A0ABP9MFW9_9MICO|nr:TetR/AcrR family transcriptional regulator [Microbacterium yannicii]MCO5953518.1 TetR/AcrR family transcriptional regulator [Microbacterium yannicii]